jgi:hypothetical protein
MTGYERKTWLSQINRIRFEEKQAREEYMVENISRLIAMRKQEQE